MRKSSPNFGNTTRDKNKTCLESEKDSIMFKGTPQRIALVVFLVAVFQTVFLNKFTPFFLLVDFFIRGVLFKPELSICYNVAVELFSKVDKPKGPPPPSKKFAAFCGLVMSGFICFFAYCECEKLYFFFNLMLLLASGLEAFAAICIGCKLYPHLEKSGYFEFSPVSNLPSQIALFVFMVVLFQFFSVNPFTPFFLVLDFAFRGVLENPNLSMMYNLAIGIYHDGKRQKMELSEPKKFSAFIGLVMCFLLFIVGYFQINFLFYAFNFVMFVCTFLETFLSFCVGCKVHKILEEKGIKVPLPRMKKVKKMISDKKD